MWGVFDKAVELVRPWRNKEKVVYRDELSKTPLIYREELDEIRERKKKKKNEERRGATMRVKILMTKQEAKRLLSNCKDGGRLEFKDVVNELVNIPPNRVTVVDHPQTYQTCRHNHGGSGVGVGVNLKSIPEE